MKLKKLWLDRARPAPPGWIWAKNGRQAIARLHGGGIGALSLEADQDPEGNGTGHDVVAWLERQAEEGRWAVVPADIHIHPGGGRGQGRFAAAMAAIECLRKGTRENGAAPGPGG